MYSTLTRVQACIPNGHPREENARVGQKSADKSARIVVRVRLVASWTAARAPRQADFRARRCTHDWDPWFELDSVVIGQSPRSMRLVDVLGMCMSRATYLSRRDRAGTCQGSLLCGSYIVYVYGMHWPWGQRVKGHGHVVIECAAGVCMSVDMNAIWTECSVSFVATMANWVVRWKATRSLRLVAEWTQPCRENQVKNRGHVRTRL